MKFTAQKKFRGNIWEIGFSVFLQGCCDTNQKDNDAQVRFELYITVLEGEIHENYRIKVTSFCRVILSELCF